MLRWFSTRQIREFADSAVDAFAREYPPEVAREFAAKEEDRKSETKRLNATRDLFRRVTAFQRDHALWLYTKAKLCKRIQTALQQRDYPEELVAKLADDLVMRITAGIKRPF